MNVRDPERNFEELWGTFQNRYPYFELRNVNWKAQYEIYRPKVTAESSDDELFNIFCLMLDPFHDGHVELKAKMRADGKTRYFNPELKPRFWKEFSKREIKELLKTTGKTLAADGFGRPAKTQAWMLRYCRSRRFGYSESLSWKG